LSTPVFISRKTVPEFERFARDRRIAVLGEVEKAAAQMGPAEGERDGVAGRSAGDALVGRIAIALHDTAVAIEQLERMHCAAPRSVGVGDCRRVGSAPQPVIPGDGPEESLLDAPAAGIEHWRHGLIDRDLV